MDSKLQRQTFFILLTLKRHVKRQDTCGYEDRINCSCHACFIEQHCREWWIHLQRLLKPPCCAEDLQLARLSTH